MYILVATVYQPTRGQINLENIATGKSLQIIKVATCGSIQLLNVPQFGHKNIHVQERTTFVTHNLL